MKIHKSCLPWSLPTRANSWTIWEIITTANIILKTMSISQCLSLTKLSLITSLWDSALLSNAESFWFQIIKHKISKTSWMKSIKILPILPSFLLLTWSFMILMKQNPKWTGQIILQSDSLDFLSSSELLAL